MLAVCTECRGMTSHWSQTAGTYHDSVAFQSSYKQILSWHVSSTVSLLSGLACQYLAD